MPGAWTEKRRKAHSQRIAKLWKSGAYKVHSSAAVIESNRQRAIERNQDPEFRKKHRAAVKAAMQKPEVKAKHKRGIIASHKNPEHNLNRLKAAQAVERRHKISKSQASNWKTNDQRRQIARITKTKWWSRLSDTERAEIVARCKSNSQSPNKSERLMIGVFDRLGYEYVFTGAGEKVIAGYCPDFVDVDRKEIIEFNGFRWHTDRAKDLARARKFTAVGYRVLLIYYEQVNQRSIHKILKAIELFRNGKSRYSPICKATCS